jgi:hypothetical protein
MTRSVSASPGAEQIAEVARSMESAGSPAPRTDGASEPDRFKQALGSLGREIDKGEKLVKRALGGGGHLGAGDLIALQAGIYRYSEAVDLAAKLVDRAGQAVRTTLQSNGG